MWVFDGEQWTQEGGEQSSKSEQKPMQHYEEFLPELQIVEEVIYVPNTNYVPLPLP